MNDDPSDVLVQYYIISLKMMVSVRVLIFYCFDSNPVEFYKKHFL